MRDAIFIFAGALLGAGLMWLVRDAAYRRSVRPHILDTDYRPAQRAVLRHVRFHGTINLDQLKRLLDITPVTAQRYLDQMVHDGILKPHGHRGAGAFYTLA